MSACLKPRHIVLKLTLSALFGVGCHESVTIVEEERKKLVGLAFERIADVLNYCNCTKKEGTDGGSDETHKLCRDSVGF